MPSRLTRCQDMKYFFDCVPSDPQADDPVWTLENGAKKPKDS